MAKLSKKDIKNTVEGMSIETLLTGIPQGIKLTAKQKKFAKGVADGLTKADAYRQAYDTQGKPATVASDAYQESKKPHVDLMIDAYKRANEMREYQLPEKTRSLLFSELVKHSLDESFPPAQRVKCLELLGKLSDVGAFTERRESVVIHESSKLKEKLLDQLKTIVSADIKEVNDTEAEDLLAQLTGAPLESGQDAIPTTEGDGQAENDHPRGHIHSIPHTQSSQNTDMSGNCQESDSQDVDLEGKKDEVVTLPVESGNEGVGVVENTGDGMDVEYREVPHSNSETKG